MKKFLTVLCLALLLTLVCASALAADYTSNGKLISSITEVNGKTVDSSKPMTVIVSPKCQTGLIQIPIVGDTYETLPIDPVHNLELKAVDGKAPKCGENGVGKYVCKDCGAVDPYNQGEVAMAALEHKFEKEVVDTEPTCSKEGKAHMVCIYCGEPETDSAGKIIYFTKPVHAFQPGEWKIEKAQTCKEGGLRYKVCAICGEPQKDPLDPSKILYDEDYKNPADHTFGDWVVTVPATCKAGLKTRYCSVCNYKESVEIAATDAHTWKENIVVKSSYACEKDSDGKAKPVPATEFEKTERVCTVCGVVEAIAAPTNYMAHHNLVADPDGWSSPAGCVDSGIYGTKALICTNCGGKWTQNVPPATSHNWGEWVLKVAPGTDGTKNGVWERKCTNYKCIETETYVGTTAPKGASPAPTVKPTDAPTPSGTENYKITSWSFTGAGVSGSVGGNVTYRTSGLRVNVIVYTPNGTFLSTSAAVDENGKFSVDAGGAVYAVSVQLLDNNKTYQTEGKYV